uniref:Uncharacterized protein n=1 Tax=Plectus sambesii TaxID=2011161 RepID=A0A914WQV1_9BILA
MPVCICGKWTKPPSEETKTIDAAWHDMQMTFGIPKSESQVKYTSPSIIMLDESDKSRGFGDPDVIY